MSAVDVTVIFIVVVEVDWQLVLCVGGGIVVVVVVVMGCVSLFLTD